MATRKSNTKLQTPVATKREGKSKPVAFILNTDALATFGQEMAQAAAGQVKNAGTYWDRCRTHFAEAQRNGKAEEAIAAMFAAGDNVKGKKAPWYRTYKSILNAAVKLAIKVTDDMGMTALQKAIKAAKDNAAEHDPAKKAEKDAAALEWFRKWATACLARGIEKAKLAQIVKEAEA